MSGFVWHSIAYLSPQVGAQRSLNLSDPYLSMRDDSSCGGHCDRGDYLPVVGESGVRLYLDFGVDLDRCTATWEIEGPLHTEWFTGVIEGRRVSFVSQACTFMSSGRHRILLTVTFPDGSKRKIVRTLYVA